MKECDYMKKKLFIYYSFTGNGDLIADYFKLTTDIRRVETCEPLPKFYIFSIMSGGFKALINYHDKLYNFNNNIQDYDEIIIGSPIWNDRLCSPINSVLKQLDLKDKKVTAVLYSGSGKANKAISQLEKYNINRVFILKEPKKNIEELNKLKGI